MADNDDYWVIEVEFDFEFDDSGYEFEIEGMEELQDDFDAWLDSINDEELDDQEDTEGDDDPDHLNERDDD